MLSAAAVCPHPPLLVPEVACGAAPELDSLRAACAEAVRRLAGACDAIVVVGSGPETREYGPDAAGGLLPYGVDVVVGDGPAVLPLSLTIGRWLLGTSPAGYRAVAQDAPAESCGRLGAELGASAGRLGLLVMGDGSACRTERAPGYLDERSAGFDAEVARALAGADANALARLDPALAAELLAAGRAPWQVLAGAARDGRFAGELLADEAPYGVGYLVASWTRP
ncbi:class III extradiol dioxygenase subunit B-like domain-containing protein [Actinomadura sp. DC4]|uniref:class III extradiol dioxygenase subunit B-like domain-containing protein n=1 Tax=Actinomadura sp. DC4 TaxID=3055069 RepID=UPI0025B19307|nr:class III extradiol dioxygenase subunit B-like domain-containing protein [Actinomadura sp. DC4]MDN3353525.1 class III extradiol dioxygenase subunit B-like domain-containing protein [Actinomadura sp. DC4]